MTGNVNAPQTSVTGYAQTSIRWKQFPTSSNGGSGVQGGVTVAKNNNYLKADAGVNTGFWDAGIGVGHTFDLNENWTLDTGVKASYASQIGKPNTAFVNATQSIMGKESSITQNYAWNDNELLAAAEISLDRKGKHLDFNIGLEGGYATNTLKDINGELSPSVTLDDGTVVSSPRPYTVHMAKDKPYITSTVGVQVKPFKNQNVGIFAQTKVLNLLNRKEEQLMDLQGGIRLTF